MPRDVLLLRRPHASGCRSRPSTASDPSTVVSGVNQARRLKQLETENSNLQKAVAKLTLANQIFKEAAEGNF